MQTHQSTTWTAVLCAALVMMTGEALSAPEASANTANNTIRVWQRGNGTPQKPTHVDEVVVDIKTLSSVERDIADRKTTLHVRGVSLGNVLRAAHASARPQVDRAILHFKNGVQVGVELARVDAFDVFLATSLRLSEQGAWTTQFEPVALSTPQWRAAARSLTFGGHRVLVQQPQAPRGPGGFVPWGFVDTLVEVELVNGEAYDHMFDVGGTAVEQRGHTVYLNRCQSCHGVRHVGASLGWDFVEPLSPTTWRTEQSLFDHVRAHKLNADEIGLMMPQPDVTAEEIAALHAFMKVLSTRPLQAYETKK